MCIVQLSMLGNANITRSSGGYALELRTIWLRIIVALVDERTRDANSCNYFFTVFWTSLMNCFFQNLSSCVAKNIVQVVACNMLLIKPS